MENRQTFCICLLFYNLLQPAAFLSYTFQENDVDAVTVSVALAKTKKSLRNLQAKEADQLQTVKFYFQKVDKDEYQGIKVPGLDGSTNFRLTNLIDHAKSETHKTALNLFNKQQEQTPSSTDENQPKLDFKLNPSQLEDLKRKFDILL